MVLVVWCAVTILLYADNIIAGLLHQAPRELTWPMVQVYLVLTFALLAVFGLVEFGVIERWFRRGQGGSDEDV